MSVFVLFRLRRGTAGDWEPPIVDGRFIEGMSDLISCDADGVADVLGRCGLIGAEGGLPAGLRRTSDRGRFEAEPGRGLLRCFRGKMTSSSDSSFMVTVEALGLAGDFLLFCCREAGRGVDRVPIASRIGPVSPRFGTVVRTILRRRLQKVSRFGLDIPRAWELEYRVEG